MSVCLYVCLYICLSVCTSVPTSLSSAVHKVFVVCRSCGNPARGTQHLLCMLPKQAGAVHALVIWAPSQCCCCCRFHSRWYRLSMNLLDGCLGSWTTFKKGTAVRSLPGCTLMCQGCAPQASTGVPPHASKLGHVASFGLTLICLDQLAAGMQLCLGGPWWSTIVPLSDSSVGSNNAHITGSGLVDASQKCMHLCMEGDVLSAYV